MRYDLRIEGRFSYFGSHLSIQDLAGHEVAILTEVLAWGCRAAGRVVLLFPHRQSMSVRRQGGPTFVRARHVLAVLALGGLAMPAGLAAKCGRVRYEVSVSVRERGSGKPLAGVGLVLFEPGRDTALPLADRRASRAQTDEAGTFRGEILFNTYSGWWFGDRCGAALEALEVVAVPPDRPAERARFRRLVSSRTEREYVFRLEPITIELYP